MNEIDLNDLVIKADTLSDSWKILLIDPTTGLPARNMTVARFIELLIEKGKLWTANNDGPESGLYASSSKYSDESNVLSINNTEKKDAGRMQFFQQQNNGIVNPTIGWCSLLRLQHGGYSNGYWQELAFPFTTDQIFYRRNIEGIFTKWKEIAFKDSSNYATSYNTLTDTISDSYSFTPPRKLRAKLLRVRQFSRAICEVSCIRYSQPGWFNSN